MTIGQRGPLRSGSATPRASTPPMVTRAVIEKYSLLTVMLSPATTAPPGSAGTQYLSYLMRLFDGDLLLALAAYNAGEHAVLRYGKRIPPYRETRSYVPRVLSTYEALAALPQPAKAADTRAAGPLEAALSQR